MTNEKLISIIVPMYNVNNFIPTFLEKLLSQTYTNIEIILVDDGSTDNTLETCRTFSIKNSKIKLFTQENKGSGAARNTGIDNATGDYIFFIDPDDLPYSNNSLEQLLLAILVDDSDMCGGNIASLENNTIDEKYAYRSFFHEEKLYNKNYTPNQDGFFWRYLYKSEFLKKNKIKFPNYLRAQDPVFLLNCFELKPKLKTIHSTVYLYRINYKSINWSERKLIDWLKGLKDVIKICKSNEYYDIIRGKIEWVHTQLEEILNASDQLNLDVSKFIIEINELIEWEFINSKFNLNLKKFNTGQTVFPAFKENYVPIVLSADENYAMYLSVCIQSIIENSSLNKNYDIIILTEELKSESIRRLTKMIQNKSNISIRIFDVGLYLKKYDHNKFKIRDHFSIAAYFRFFIPLIFKNYDKVIYLDCDLVVNEDTFKLFEVDISNYYLAAVPALGPLQAYFIGKFTYYFDKILKLTNPILYFNTGVMLMNITKMNADDIPDKLLNKLQEIGAPTLLDQDIFNAVCNTNVLIIDQKWNVTVHVNPDANIPYNYYLSLKNAFLDPKIIHYTTKNKPWNSENVALSEYFWKYARKSPYYEEIILKNMLPKKIEKIKINNFSIFKEKIKKQRYKILSKFTIGKCRRRYKQKLKNI